jgi:2-dehydro-3-deoxygalactonokinase
VSAVVIGDWGGTRLRLWRLEGGEVVGRREGPGIANAEDPAADLLAALGDWPAERVRLCGMAGARNGLYETGYVDCPVSPSTWISSTGRLDMHGIALLITAGIICRDATKRPDVLRGEETQVFGAMALDPALASGSHLVVLPGTHSKWVRLIDGRVTGFRTFMTGELFGLLGRSSLFTAGTSGAEDEEAGFAEGLARAADGGVTSALFEARSRQLCDGRSAGWASGFVSGLLIGTETATMAPARPTLIIGEPALAQRYHAAFGQAGMRVADVEACTIAGLRLLDE